MTDLSGNFSEEVIETEIIPDKKGCSSENNELNNIVNKGRRHKKRVAASAVLRLC